MAAVGGAGKLVGRCVLNYEVCATNIKIAMTPIFAAGLTATAAWGLAASCATGFGCIVGAPLFGTAIVAGVVLTVVSAHKAWFGPHRDEVYEEL